MADAAAGEPLGYRHGVVLYSAQTTKGTPVTPATACGNASVSWTKHGNNQYFYGPGSPNFRAAKGGELWTEFGIRFPALQTGAKTLLQKATRTAGVLPLVTLGFGYSDDTAVPVRSADQIQDCKIGSLRLGLDASGGHGPLSCDLSGVGGLITVLTTLAPTTLTTTPWMTYDGVFTRAGSAYEIRSFEVSMEHNLSRDHVIYGAAPASYQRGFKYLTEHNEAITGRISRYQRSGVTTDANAISTFPMVCTLTNVVDSVALTLTFVNVNYDNETIDEDENGIFVSFDFTAQTLAIT